MGSSTKIGDRKSWCPSNLSNLADLASDPDPWGLEPDSSTGWFEQTPLESLRLWVFLQRHFVWFHPSALKKNPPKSKRIQRSFMQGIPYFKNAWWQAQPSNWLPYNSHAFYLLFDYFGFTPVVSTAACHLKQIKIK